MESLAACSVSPTRRSPESGAHLPLHVGAAVAPALVLVAAGAERGILVCLRKQTEKCLPEKCLPLSLSLPAPNGALRAARPRRAAALGSFSPLSPPPSPSPASVPEPEPEPELPEPPELEGSGSGTSETGPRESEPGPEAPEPKSPSDLDAGRVKNGDGPQGVLGIRNAGS